jgi:predicted amidohydrolase YtcJ
MKAMESVRSDQADLLLTNATVITMDDERRRVDSLWVRGDRIQAVGERADVVATPPTAARVVDLGGATVVPGFIDAHCHVGALAYLLGTVDCGPAAAPTIEALLAGLRGGRPTGTWIVGHSFADNEVAERRFPTLAELDGLAPDRPLAIFHRSLHACVLNSAGLREARLTGPDDPPFGKLGRDPQGRPDGTVYEAPMFDLFARLAGEGLGEMGPEQRVKAVARACALFTAEGVTTAMDADLPGVGWLRAMIEADSARRLPLRLIAMVNDRDADWAIQAGVFRGRYLERFRLGAVKAFADGGMSSRTAAVHREYQLPPYGRGVLFRSVDELTDLVRRAEASGAQVGVHAQGDRAIETVLDAFEAVIGRGGVAGNPLRHRMEHAGMLLPHLIDRAAAIGIHVVSQPGFFTPLGDGWLRAYGEQADAFYPFRSIRSAGLRMGGSSDAPVITPNVREALRDAILRESASGVVIGASERLSAGEALELYTRDAAFLAHAETEVGSLTPGRYADFVVLSADPTQVEPRVIPSIRVLQTVVGGTPVFGSDPI